MTFFQWFWLSLWLNIPGIAFIIIAAGIVYVATQNAALAIGGGLFCIGVLLGANGANKDTEDEFYYD